MSEQADYDVCFSFAGEDRVYVREVAEILSRDGIRVFYDEFAQVELWGKDLYTHLDNVYRNAARFCVLFISQAYSKKLWTNHERQSAQARAFSDNEEYILPVRFDDSEIPGLRPTVGYLDAREIRPVDLAHLIKQKTGSSERRNFLPETFDVLQNRLDIREDEEAIRMLEKQVRDVFEQLTQMSEQERSVIFSVFLDGCPAELPGNMHINLDLLRRVSGQAEVELLRILGGLRSLGIFCSLRDEPSHADEILGSTALVVLRWELMREVTGGNVTPLVHEMFWTVSERYCKEHGREALQNLDFSQLSVTTSSFGC